jgi:hypothetical protein
MLVLKLHDGTFVTSKVFGDGIKDLITLGAVDWCFDLSTMRELSLPICKWRNIMAVTLGNRQWYLMREDNMLFSSAEDEGWPETWDMTPWITEMEEDVIDEYRP